MLRGGTAVREWELQGRLHRFMSVRSHVVAGVMMLCTLH